LGSEWILGRLAGGVEWIQLAQNRDGGGCGKCGDVLFVTLFWDKMHVFV
jgi:hypothetical protein